MLHTVREGCVIMVYLVVRGLLCTDNRFFLLPELYNHNVQIIIRVEIKWLLYRESKVILT